VFSTGEGERVASVEHIPDENGGNGEEGMVENGSDLPPE